MAAYYNEIDPGAAAWLRELIKAGQIAPGIVDERDIRDVRPDELLEFAQCHFFAGIGGWSLALRGAGWADDRPVWTGSCPCPPFSAAGKGSECPSCGGKSCLAHPVVTAGWVCLDCGDEWRGDDRHLLPEFLRLIGQCRPPSVFGEQVASRDGRLWLYALRAVMERMGYAVGAADLCAAGVGAPHIRQRLWFVGVADAGSQRHDREQVRLQPGQPRPAGSEAAGGRGLSPLEHTSGDGRLKWRAEADGRGAASGCGLGGLADRDDAGLEGRGQPGRERAAERPVGPGGVADWLADADGRDASAEREQPGGQQRQQPQDGGPLHGAGPGPVNGFWRDADWLFCRDGKWRPVEPIAQRMAYGVSIALDARLFEVVDAETRERIATEALRAMRDGYDPAALWGSVGGRFGFPAASVLLAILCEHAGELGHVQHRWPSSSEKDRVAEFLRTLWLKHCETPGSPQGRGFSEQLAGELGDALPKLSRKSAPHWKALALLTAGPLAHGVTDRVGLLRGYGNAISPQAAEAFIRAADEVMA